MNGETPTRILLAVDASDQAAKAVRFAGKTFSGKNFQLVLFHVTPAKNDDLFVLASAVEIHRDLQRARQSWMRERRQKVMGLMERLKSELTEMGIPPENVEIKTREARAGLAREIMAECGQGYRAIILGRTGLSKVKDLVFGSTAHKMISRLSSIPICVVGGAPAAGNLLVGMDGSDQSMKGLKQAADLLPADTKIQLCNIIRDWEPGGAFLRNYISDEIISQASSEAKERIMPSLESARQILLDKGFAEENIELKLINLADSRAGALVQEAGENGFGSIMVGRRGISKVEEFIIGGVSHKVLQLARDKAVWIMN